MEEWEIFIYGGWGKWIEKIGEFIIGEKENIKWEKRDI
jgi:hypothetical protein